MALMIDLYPTGPGAARLQIAGQRPLPESAALAFQRNDGKYLGADRQWQASPHWHPIFTLEPASAGLRLALGADLVDCIISVGGAPLRVLARLDGTEDAGTLRLHGVLIGSGAAAPRVPEMETTVVQPREPIPLPATAPESGALPLDLEPQVPRRPPRRWFWGLLAAVLLLVAVGVGGAAWWLGWFGDRVPPGAGDLPPVSEAPAVPGPEQMEGGESAGPGGPAAPETGPPAVQPAEPAATGVALARAFLAAKPAPAAIFERAEQLEQARDCPAAYALYSAAANADPVLAARLARRYDPLTHQPGPCIGAPDIPYAIVYYSDAAAAGDHEVQRRLGQLMVERERSGPTREAGLNWLRKAAAGGDGEAKRLLDGLVSGPP